MTSNESGQTVGPETITKTILLGQRALQFGRVNRALYHEDGITPESDTDHTVMLAWVACAFADQYAPDMDVGLIAQCALVHDMVEAYVGDTPSFKITSSEKTAKQEREMQALHQIEAEFGNVYPWLHRTITLYESQELKETRYVKTMDKVVTKLVQTLTKCDMYKEWGNSKTDLIEEFAKQRIDYLASYARDQPEAISLWDGIVEAVLAAY